MDDLLNGVGEGGMCTYIPDLSFPVAVQLKATEMTFEGESSAS